MDNLYRKGNQIEQEEKDLNTSLRLSALDNLDHYEILRHRIRLQAWNNFIYEPIFNISTIILNIHLVQLGMYHKQQLPAYDPNCGVIIF